MARYAGKVLRGLLIIFVAVFSFLLLSQEAYARGDVSEERALAMEEALDMEEASSGSEFDSYIRYMPERSVKSQAGSIGIIQSEAEYDYSFKAFGKLPVELSLNPFCANINNTTAIKFPAHLTKLAAGIEATFPLFNLKHTYFLVGLNPSFNGDNWNLNSASFRFHNYYAAIFQPNEKLLFVAGVDVYPRYEDQVLPIVGLVYRPNKKLTFYLIPEDRSNISYAITERLTLFIEGGSNTDEFAVTRNGSRAVLQYNQSHLGTGVKLKVNKYMDVTVAGGGVFDHYLKYRDSDGKASIKKGLYTEFRIEAAI
ncbi:MAG: hypothetical protein PHF11_05900 [Candidatus Omnitrophica bacterium]|nr:hypothetical protein [Candidatus Omnitrophota bacterium]